MRSLEDSRDRAEELGRQAVDEGQPVGRSGGDSVGSLALEAFREHGRDGMRSVFAGYRAGSYGRWNEGEAA